MQNLKRVFLEARCRSETNLIQVNGWISIYFKMSFRLKSENKLPVLCRFEKWLNTIFRIRMSDTKRVNALLMHHFQCVTSKNIINIKYSDWNRNLSICVTQCTHQHSSNMPKATKIIFVFTMHLSFSICGIKE